MTGLSYLGIRAAIDLCEQGEWSDIRPVGRGREVGQAGILIAAQEQAICKIICNKLPRGAQVWLDEHYPAIETQAKAGGGEIHWGEETALVNIDVRDRSYVSAGKTPVT